MRWRPRRRSPGGLRGGRGSPRAAALGTAPRAPGGLQVLYGMQKTCAMSGREFYALGRYEAGAFSLLDSSSDMGNNLFDGGEGYAHMSVLDPRGGGGMTQDHVHDHRASSRPTRWDVDTMGTSPIDHEITEAGCSTRGAAPTTATTRRTKTQTKTF